MSDQAATRDEFSISREALAEPWTVVMVDGDYILPCLPNNLPEGYESDIEEQAAAVIKHAKSCGYEDGSFLWTIWRWQKPQMGEFGRVELSGYWEYHSLNPVLSDLLKPANGDVYPEVKVTASIPDPENDPEFQAMKRAREQKKA